MSWVYLIVAGLLEIGWPLGLKLAQQEGWRWPGIALAVAFMAPAVFAFSWRKRRFPWAQRMRCGRASARQGHLSSASCFSAILPRWGAGWVQC